MPLLPTIDPIAMEQTIVAAIRDTFLAVDIAPVGPGPAMPLSDYANVELRERFPDSDDDDITISTVPDLAQPDLRFTSLIQIGIPTVKESPYTSEQYTQLDFTYPITFDMAVKDQWDNADASLVYTNSRALFLAIYMRSRAKFKESKILGTFENCEHDYLQQENASTVEDEETGSFLHVADWTLVVHVKGVDT
jgi:hypothetical protein